jgi:hypothetical protein
MLLLSTLGIVLVRKGVNRDTRAYNEAYTPPREAAAAKDMRFFRSSYRSL